MLDRGVPFGLGVDRGEDASVHRHQVRREDDLDGLAAAAGDVGQDLVDLGRVPVPADAVGREALVAFGEVIGQLGRTARARDSALGVDDDAGALDQVLGDQGRQRQDARRGVAARVGDQAGRRNLLAKQLGQAVDGLAQPLGSVCAWPYQSA